MMDNKPDPVTVPRADDLSAYEELLNNEPDLTALCDAADAANTEMRMMMDTLRAARNNGKGQK